MKKYCNFNCFYFWERHLHEELHTWMTCPYSPHTRLPTSLVVFPMYLFLWSQGSWNRTLFKYHKLLFFEREAIYRHSSKWWKPDRHISSGNVILTNARVIKDLTLGPFHPSQGAGEAKLYTWSCNELNRSTRVRQHGGNCESGLKMTFRCVLHWACLPACLRPQIYGWPVIKKNIN